MILVCDIGNTRIKSCLFDGENISAIRSFTNFKDFEDTISMVEFSDCVFSSVVPEKTDLLKKLMTDKCGIAPGQVTQDSDFNLRIDYKSPLTLGIDRICSAEGAFYLFNKSGKRFGESDFIISIDFGTATTLNFIKSPGVFHGGMILPGIKMMFDSLSQNTAQLPEVSEKDYNGLIGNDTKSSIASGVITSQTGLIEKVLIEIRKQFNVENIHIYITGGNAGRVIPFLNFKFEYVSELVLMGIISVYKRIEKIRF